jgi:hypothetical protein
MTFESLTNLGSKFWTLKTMFEDSPTLISVLSGINSVNLTSAEPGFLEGGMEKTMKAAATAAARAASKTIFSNPNKNCCS